MCPTRAALFLPVFTSQRPILPSPLPEASVLPSGLNATDQTDSACPFKMVGVLGPSAHRGADATSAEQATARRARGGGSVRFRFILAPGGEGVGAKRRRSRFCGPGPQAGGADAARVGCGEGEKSSWDEGGWPPITLALAV